MRKTYLAEIVKKTCLAEIVKKTCLAEIVNFGDILTVDQQINLCKCFSAIEVKRLCSSIPFAKSPGLDGFNSDCFKGSWSEIQGLVTKGVLESF